MKYMYQIMWIDTRLPMHRQSEKYETVEAYSVNEALQIASYKYELGLQSSIPILEVKILGARI
jgi:hypothetical protein